MNAGSFLKYINTPSLLHQLPYEELKTMVLQYPFSANLHMLLLLKSKQENHKDYEKNLAMASSHSINRSYLYKLLHQLELMEMESHQLLNEDEILELKDLASQEKNLEKEWILLEEEQASLAENIDVLTEYRRMEKTEEVAISDGEQVSSDEVIHSEASVDPAKELPFEEAEDELLSTMNALNALIEDVIAHEEHAEDISPDEIREISSLTEVIKHYLPEQQGENKETPRDEKENVMEEESVTVPAPEANEPQETLTPPKERKGKQKVSEIASKSIKSQSRVASETLAQILEKQGLTDQAIKMYEQLILTFPEKNAYFAAKIENLKNLL